MPSQVEDRGCAARAAHASDWCDVVLTGPWSVECVCTRGGGVVGPAARVHEVSGRKCFHKALQLQLLDLLRSGLGNSTLRSRQSLPCRSRTQRVRGSWTAFEANARLSARFPVLGVARQLSYRLCPKKTCFCYKQRNSMEYGFCSPLHS